MNADKASGIFHVTLERLALHHGMVDVNRLRSIGSDRNALDFLDISAVSTEGTDKTALGRFLSAAQKRFGKFCGEN
jgi:hypothetical protein